MDSQMKKGTIWVIVILLVLIVAGTWIWSRYNTTEPVGEVESEQTEATVDITAKHQFKDGLHIVAGEVELPTPCYVLSTNHVVNQAEPDQVVLEFTVITQGEICAQVITNERFRFDFTADQNAVITATWNGKPANLTLVSPDPNEDLINFEVFIKG